MHGMHHAGSRPLLEQRRRAQSMSQVSRRSTGARNTPRPCSVWVVFRPQITCEAKASPPNTARERIHLPATARTARAWAARRSRSHATSRPCGMQLRSLREGPPSLRPTSRCSLLALVTSVYRSGLPLHPPHERDTGTSDCRADEPAPPFGAIIIWCAQQYDDQRDGDFFPSQRANTTRQYHCLPRTACFEEEASTDISNTCGRACHPMRRVARG